MITRRQGLGALASAALGPLFATPAQAASRAPASEPRLAQILDMSATQQEISRDYSTGVRLAWARSSLVKGPLSTTRLASFETDGSAASLRDALTRIRADRSIIGLIGTVGDRLAVAAVGEAQQQNLELAHIAPWMSDPRHDDDDGAAYLFASRDMQLRNALRALSGMGVDDLLVVLDSASAKADYPTALRQTAQAQGLRISFVWPAGGEDMRAVGARLPLRGKMVLLMGTAIDLALLSQAMAARKDFRFLLSLGDVDMSTLAQLAPGAGVPLILTQVVPNPERDNSPLVRDYREHLRRLFDEAPSPVSLAGFIAGRYAETLLRKAGSKVDRDSLLSVLRRRDAVDLEGFKIDFRDASRGSRFVTQTLMAPDGRLIG